MSMHTLLVVDFLNSPRRTKRWNPGIPEITRNPTFQRFNHFCAIEPTSKEVKDLIRHLKYIFSPQTLPSSPRANFARLVLSILPRTLYITEFV